MTTKFSALEMQKESLNTPKKIAQSKVLNLFTAQSGINCTAITHIAKVAISKAIDSDSTMTDKQKVAVLSDAGHLSKAQAKKLGVKTE